MLARIGLRAKPVRPGRICYNLIRKNSTAHHHKANNVTVDRELPDPFKDKYKNLKYALTYGLGVVVSCVIIFNYEKTTSPIINSIFYFLRRNPKVIEALGEDIKYTSSWPWISGELNTVSGDIDINFSVKGEHKDGQLYFKASRPNKATPFHIHHWYLEVGGDRIDLKLFDKLNI